MTDRLLPKFSKAVAHVSYEDGCKVYFEDNSFIICRFSGTEPLLRIFAEANESEIAEGLIYTMKSFINR